MPFAPIHPRKPTSPSPRLRGFAAELAALAASTSDPLASLALNILVPRVAAMERTHDELIAEVMEDAALIGRVSH